MVQAGHFQRQFRARFEESDVEGPVRLAVLQRGVAATAGGHGYVGEVAVVRCRTQADAGVEAFLDKLTHQAYLAAPATPRAMAR
ncbi:hypothetical protein D9M71_720180 [compost metagenome]